MRYTHDGGIIFLESVTGTSCLLVNVGWHNGGRGDDGGGNFAVLGDGDSQRLVSGRLLEREATREALLLNPGGTVGSGNAKISIFIRFSNSPGHSTSTWELVLTITVFKLIFSKLLETGLLRGN
jgi:hypothetical protein